MSRIPSHVSIVCMALGDSLPEFYVSRLYNMLSRHMPIPFDLTCVTDHPRRVPKHIRALDSSDWGMRREGMRITTHKLRLYDASLFPGEFLYFDTTLVIQRDLTPLLQFALDRPEALVAVKDWSYDCANTCVLRIRNGGDSPLGVVYERFREGRSYPHKIAGDQDFVTACLRSEGLGDQIATFPPEYVASFRLARLQARSDPEGARERLDRSLIVKFHGHPKMHEALSLLYRLRKGRKSAQDRRDQSFWVQDLRTKWR